MSEEPKFKMSKKAIINTSVLAVVVISILISVLLYIAGDPNNNAGKNTAKPAYQTVLPNGKSVESLGGWERISPEDQAPVYAYADKINDISISVSQQPLPESFKNNVDHQVAELAKKFNATTDIDGGDTEIFLGTSAKGPQSVILTKEGLLILIKSQQKIENDAWREYVESLTSIVSAKY